MRKLGKGLLSFFMAVISVIYISPIFIVLLNSFKLKTAISASPFSLPNAKNFVGLENFTRGITFGDYPFYKSVFFSAVITILSTLAILLFTSMAAWYITRVDNALCRGIYYLCVFSMIVPFQMVMYTMTYVVNKVNFDNVFGITLIYLGFGAGLSVFMLAGFIKSVPLEIEEAATIDGAGPLQSFFMVVMPILKPTAITVAILNAMWIWNDYLLPYLVLGTDEKTIPVAIQIAMQGAYGATDYGGLMAMLVLAIIPIVIFYAACQKYIIKGVVAGAVKG